MAPGDPIRVEKWRTERPLFVLNAIVSAGLWLLLFQAVDSIVYLATILAFGALVNVAFIAYVRGSAVRLGPDQFPELYARVRQLAARIGLRRMPDVYLMQQDGALNAFATRFLRSHMVVLLSDLLEACGDNQAARDMIIGHELGHIRAGHLYGRWLLMPASFVPFLGSALARAREYTCDRYGLAAAGDREGALVGLAILAAGRRYGPLVNREALAGQREDLRGVWMLVGEWLGTHPPLSRRMLALEPLLDGGPAAGPVNRLEWIRPAFAAATVVLIGALTVYTYLPMFGVRAATDAPPPPQPVGPEATAGVRRELSRLQSIVEGERMAGRPLPWDVWDLYARWADVHGTTGPVDPYSGGYWYRYDRIGNDYRLWSVGPDGRNRTVDDVVLDSRLTRVSP